jgi:predicted PurR-regulated permease PerM/phosphoglycolate phosphatase-like HAD superfamily hydrolase
VTQDTSPPTRWDRTTKLLVLTALLVLAGLLLYSFRTVLPLLIIVFLLAYVFAPAVNWLSRNLHIPRGLSVLLLYLVGIGALVATSAIAIPAVVGQVEDLIRNLDAITNRAIRWLDQLDQVEAFGYVFTLPEIEIPTISVEINQIISLLRSAISPIAGGAFSIVLTVASGVGMVIFMAVLLFYLLADAQRIWPALLAVVPPTYRDEISKLAARIDKTWNAFLRGQIVLCLAVGVTTAVAMSAVGIRFSLALGVVAGILEVIPNLGPTLASVPAILLALFQGSSVVPLSNLGTAILVAIVYYMIQNLENSFLVPRIMGGSLNLHPLVIMIGVLVGVTLGGILGALLAAPLLATLRVLLQYVWAKMADIDPFPPFPSFAAVARGRDVRAILFDLDGTLLDTDNMLVERLARQLRRVPLLRKACDPQRLARRLVMASEGPLNALVTLLDWIGLDDEFFSFGEWLRAAYGQRRPGEYIAVDGTVDFVRSLAEHYDLAITTTRNRNDTELFIETFGLQDCFKAVVTRQDVKHLKPHPEPIRRAAEKLGVTPKQSIVVGDTTVDVRAGKRAGALTVGVLCGFGERAELERLEPDLLLETTALLGEHLPKPQPSWYAEW